ncbi:9570_t:CDS:1 [Paraglomus occultum]|uniref:9570_t:CDS:1 n=1 Tax=Paraglomus occultum TaxID=144539 RepID=A0A9N9GHJ5_9GLOM|nr:9570_t:CDS:1 [Paraglomus occultum]
MVFGIPEQNSTNSTVNGQSYNELPGKTLDGIHDWINTQLDKAYDKLEKPYEITAKFVSDHFTSIMIIVAIVALFCFPHLLLIIIRMLGFTGKGIVKGSIAAFHMSLYGGRIASGSLVSILQSVGVLGIGGLQGMFRLLFTAISSFIRFIF